MSVIRNSLGRIVLTTVTLISLGLGLAQSTEDALANGRVERAILGRRKNSPGLNSIPETTFSCQGRAPGFYADEEHGCQVFHRCHTDRRKDSFLCPNETIFNQRRLVCDWWYNVDCSSSAQHISVNDAIGRIPTRKDKPSTSSQRKHSFTSISSFGQNKKKQSSLSTDSQASHRDSSGGRFGAPLQGLTNEGNTDNHNVRINIPHQRTRTQSSSSFPGSTRFNNRITNQGSSQTGVALPGLSQNNIVSNIATSKLKDKQRNNIHSTSRISLSADRDNRISLPVTTLSPRFPNQGTNAKPQRTGVPLFSSNRDKITKQTDNRKENFPGRRVTVNKRPISSLSKDTSRDGGLKTGVSLDHFRTPQTSSRTSIGNRFSTITTVKPRQQDPTPFVNVNKQGVAILDERKTTSQFFDIGAPRVVTNKSPILTRPTIRTGHPLPTSNLKSDRGNRERINNQGSRIPSAISGFQPGRTKSQRKHIGRPLPATNLQPLRPGTNLNSLNHPSPVFNQQSFRGGAVRKATNQPGSSRNINRGTATFQTSLNNRGTINRLLNHRNQGSFRNKIQGQSIVIDLDDLDDIIDDRFDTHELIDDPFDDDRFDLDDRFDDIDDHLEDRFDNDRFDFDDRFDDDRFDLDDRFDDDRFDLDDRFDNDPFDDDRFDFDDDDFDDRLSRFGNGATFNFGRRVRGSAISHDSSLSKDQNLPINITPPSQIQLPPPPL